MLEQKILGFRGYWMPSTLAAVEYRLFKLLLVSVLLFSRMVPSISLRWKVFGANSRACSKTHVIQPIVSKSLPHKGEPGFMGWEKVEKGSDCGRA